MTEKLLDEIRRSFASEPRLPPHTHIGLAYADGVLTIEGEVPDVAVKKLLLERAAAHPSVSGIVDRLRVAPSVRMGDEEVRNHVRDALIAEPAFNEIALREEDAGKIVTVREPPGGAKGEIIIRVEDGVVTLDGDVPGLDYKRLAGVLAWWVPGSRDVVNGLGVTPPEEDSDEDITDAVRLALEKDPFVDASQIRVTTRNAVVRLDGLVPTPSEREMAEFDAWYVFGVDKVDNRIEVRA